MRVRFWGVRGSIAAPGPDTVRYGGNTTCLEVLSGDGDRVILDGGTGVRALGNRLAAAMPLECSVFITHTHWDHIQGLPFFVPLFVPGNVVRVHGPPDPVNMRGTESVLESQMAYPYFPVREAELKAEIEYTTLTEGQRVRVGDLVVTNILMNHPALNFGYRVDEEATGTSMFFTGDHEPFKNIYSAAEEGFDEYQEAVDARNARIDRFVSGVDLIVADAQYTDEEYASKVGWGHSSHGHALAFAERAGAGVLRLTHHETTRGDDEMDALAESFPAFEQAGRDIAFAREGAVVELG